MLTDHGHDQINGASVFVIAMAQGLTTGLLLWIAGVPYAFFWMMLAIF